MRTRIASCGSKRKVTSRAGWRGVSRRQPEAHGERGKSKAPARLSFVAIRFTWSSSTPKSTFIKGARASSDMNQSDTAALLLFHLSYFFKILRNPEKLSRVKKCNCTICSPKSSRRRSMACKSPPATSASFSSWVSCLRIPLSSRSTTLLIRSSSPLISALTRISGETSGFGPRRRNEDAQCVTSCTVDWSFSSPVHTFSAFLRSLYWM
mmetsp:Transcript_118525/g.340341  ORF Transcript_118525/g.340341 Transcript_118525/m.340341 type:complete len:209 (+) Transcript_118525:1-627(+)